MTWAIRGTRAVRGTRGTRAIPSAPWIPSARVAVAASAALAGALALTGCGGDGGGSDDGSAGVPSAVSSAAVTATADVDGTGGGSTADTGARGLEGSWLRTADGKSVALVVTGEQAALFATGGTVCSGTVGEEAGTRTVRLSCTTGSKDRTTATVDSVSGDTLTVTWSGGAGEETYTRAEDGRLPSDLSSATASASSGE